MSTTRAAPASAAPIPPRPSPAPRSQTVRPRTSSLRRVRTLDRATALGHGRVQYGSRCVSPLSMYSSMASSMSAGKTSVMAAPASSTGSLWAVRARGLRFPPWRGGRGVGRAAASGGERWRAGPAASAPCVCPSPLATSAGWGGVPGLGVGGAREILANRGWFPSYPGSTHHLSRTGSLFRSSSTSAERVFFDSAAARFPSMALATVKTERRGRAAWGGHKAQRLPGSAGRASQRGEGPTGPAVVARAVGGRGRNMAVSPRRLASRPTGSAALRERGLAAGGARAGPGGRRERRPRGPPRPSPATTRPPPWHPARARPHAPLHPARPQAPQTPAPPHPARPRRGFYPGP